MWRPRGPRADRRFALCSQAERAAGINNPANSDNFSKRVVLALTLSAVVAVALFGILYFFILPD
jgi:hypothetical protein